MVEHRRALLFRIGWRLHHMVFSAYQGARILKYQFLSTIAHLESLASIRQPVLLTGLGCVKLGRCTLGIWPSPYYLSGYMHIEARTAGALVEIEDGVSINNNAVIIAERSCIHIGADTLIGTDFTVYDSDFHDLHPQRRMAGTHRCAPVHIGRNVFIGAGVTVLKGVTIGDDAVIAAGCVVHKDVLKGQVYVGQRRPRRKPHAELGTA